jgi:hypothetical protein
LQTLKLSVSMPDETHPDMELRLSANDSSCDVVIALPMHSRSEASAGTSPVVTVQGAASSTDTDSLRGTSTEAGSLRGTSTDSDSLRGTSTEAGSSPNTSAEDDYVLGGYAGI